MVGIGMRRFALFDLEDENRALLTRLGKILDPELDDVLADFYTWAGKMDEARRLFRSRASMDKALKDVTIPHASGHAVA